MKWSWTKISNLDKDTLEKQGEDLIVIYAEEKKKDKQLPPKDWFPDHGQGKIEVDIYESEKNNQLIIESTIAGIKAKDIDITVEPDLVLSADKGKNKESLELTIIIIKNVFGVNFHEPLFYLVEFFLIKSRPV